MAKTQPLRLPKSLTSQVNKSSAVDAVEINEQALAFINKGGAVASDPALKEKKNAEVDPNQVKGISIPLTVSQLEEIKEICAKNKRPNRKKMSIREYIQEAIDAQLRKDRNQKK